MSDAITQSTTQRDRDPDDRPQRRVVADADEARETAAALYAAMKRIRDDLRAATNMRTPGGIDGRRRLIERALAEAEGFGPYQ